LPVPGALLEDFCGLLVQLRRFLSLGASIFRHHLRTRRGIGVVEGVSLLPSIKGRAKLRKETPLKKVCKLPVAMGFGL
jgi:hypothetical protein